MTAEGLLTSAGEPQGTLWVMRVREVGGSERRAVMARIGIETSSHAKAGRLPTGLSSQDGLTEPISTRFFPSGANVPLGGMLSPGVGETSR